MKIFFLHNLKKDEWVKIFHSFLKLTGNNERAYRRNLWNHRRTELYNDRLAKDFMDEFLSSRHPSCYIDCAFVFSNTIEGSDFWHDLADRWDFFRKWYE